MDLTQLNTWFEKHYGHLEKELNKNVLPVGTTIVNDVCYYTVQQPNVSLQSGTGTTWMDGSNSAFSLNAPATVNFQELLFPKKSVCTRILIPYDVALKFITEDRFTSYFSPLLTESIKGFEKLIKIDRTDLVYGTYFMTFVSPGNPGVYLRDCGSYPGIELRIFSDAVKV